METEFTPWASLGGGVLIGLAAVALMTLHGRIMGATGILGGFLVPEGSGDRGWRGAFLAHWPLARRRSRPCAPCRT